ncbi:hypothetical protein OGU21_15100 [Klebsiella oxytoca]|uniref:hypothetical protein n=1 Tax=Klebsiella oxytoca TaxID=571 RepID=UPI0022B7BDF7|nr:hypothetical protein [Klebsiella oxytoca]EIY2867935.1 hypothetical protein [Klebsiella oxytoca]EKQ7193190.1 hypothetical protein [Klebsiella oxytoca]WBD80931.1 hypothetical protein OGU21_15100 [Klebsiella oxytoca]
MNEAITEQLYNKVVNFVNKMEGSVHFDYISKSLRIPPDTLDEIVDKMIADGIVVNTGMVGEYVVVKHASYKSSSKEIRCGKSQKNNDGSQLKFLVERIILITAILFFLITCFYAYRVPISFVFLIPTIMTVFVFVDKNHGGEGFLGLSSILACLIFLFLTNAQSPIFGDAYALRKQRDDMKNEITRKAKEEERQQLNDILNAREHIKVKLKDPSSAKFSGEFIGGNGAICGYVNAKNSFGGYTGESRYIFSVNFSAIDEGITSFNKEWERQCYFN